MFFALCIYTLTYLLTYGTAVPLKCGKLAAQNIRGYTDIFHSVLSIVVAGVQERRGFFIWTFTGSILWIAAFSYLMNWWAATVGRIAGIPDAVRIAYTLCLKNDTDVAHYNFNAH